MNLEGRNSGNCAEMITMGQGSPLRNIVVTTLLLIGGLALWPDDPGVAGDLLPSAHASGVAVANDEVETVFTSSPDGKTIYMWQYYSSKPPKFIGKSEAVLREK